MNDLVTMVAALLFPFVALALVLWLCHLEETLPGAVQAARRDPAPAPILTIAVGPPPALVVADEVAAPAAVTVQAPAHAIAV